MDTVIGNALNQNLWLRSCSEYTFTYECTVVGRPSGMTVWRGSAFDCIQKEIVLLHSQFTSENDGIRAHGVCNNGSIVGEGRKIENGSYTSQLNVNATSDIIGKTIECVHDEAGNVSVVGLLTIMAGENNISLNVRKQEWIRESTQQHTKYATTLCMSCM